MFKAIQDRIIRDIQNLFEQDENFWKPVTVGNNYNNNYIKHKSDGNGNKTLSIKENLDEIELYLKDIINYL